MPRDSAPPIPIAPILEALGFTNVPHIRGVGYRKVLCIWHDDTTPSASVSQYGYTCFTCGKTGDAIKLLREEGDMTYANALARATELTGGTSGGATPERRPGGSLLDI